MRGAPSAEVQNHVTMTTLVRSGKLVWPLTPVDCSNLKVTEVGLKTNSVHNAEAVKLPEQKQLFASPQRPGR